jgi:4-diphosphocytidyl-2-C-methyl-D-erythritol kinase
MRIRSFAKINLGLEVFGLRPDGYHNIRTLFQSIELHDRVTLMLRPGPEIILGGSDSRISWNKDNLIYKAAAMLQAQTGCIKGVSVYVEKNIPPGGGLAGGSSNAAACMRALNRLWSLGLSRDDLMQAGRRLGSDVPYFFSGGLCLGSRRGDRIRELSDLGSVTCLLVLENFSIATADVYDHFHITLTSHGKDSKIIRFLENRNVQGLTNDLEDAVFDLYPQVRDHKERLLDSGADLALVSGSGSSVYGLFSNRRTAERAREKLDVKTLITQTLSRREYRKKFLI